MDTSDDIQLNFSVTNRVASRPNGSLKRPRPNEAKAAASPPQKKANRPHSISYDTSHEPPRVKSNVTINQSDRPNEKKFRKPKLTSLPKLKGQQLFP